MDHVAIMNRSWKLIPKILSGEKTIESRWYKIRRAPWDKIKKGDTIFFKNAGEPIIAQAIVGGVMQFEIKSLANIDGIIQKYGKEICLVNKNPRTWGALPKYCILIRLRDPKAVARPFHINKKGFGAGVAWLTLDDISKITV